MYKYILFDLDGTLINSEKGIVSSLKYAFKKYDISYSGDLRKFIGPSFITSFPKFLGTDKELTENLIKAYREKYNESGVFQTELYDGIEDLICCLKSCGKKIMLATTKPRYFAEIILKEHKIIDYFDFVAGSELDGSINEKEDVLKHIFSATDAVKYSSVLVGDTKYDCLGAAAVGIDCIGVTYGFGTKEELLSCGAKTTLSSVKELKKRLINI